MNDLDRLFLLQNRVLDWTSARAAALGKNLANASVPGYRRVDVDFSELLAAAKGARDGGSTRALERVVPRARVDDRTPASADGNNVDFELEQIQIEKNGLLHQLSTQYLNGTLNTLRSAIRGQSN